MAREKKDDAATSVVGDTAKDLIWEAERLRRAHEWSRDYEWDSPPSEDQATLDLAADKIDRFRLSLLRFARERVRNQKVEA